MIGMDSRGLLLRTTAADGTLHTPVCETSETFSENRLDNWSQEFPFRYGIDMQAMNLFYTSTEGIGVSELLERAVLVMSAELQPYPANLLRLGNELAGFSRRLAVAGKRPACATFSQYTPRSLDTDHWPDRGQRDSDDSGRPHPRSLGEVRSRSGRRRYNSCRFTRRGVGHRHGSRRSHSGRALLSGRAGRRKLESVFCRTGRCSQRRRRGHSFCLQWRADGQAPDGQYDTRGGAPIAEQRMYVCCRLTLALGLESAVLLDSDIP